MKIKLSNICTPAFSITLLNLFARALHLFFFLSIGNRFGANSNTDTVLLLQAPLLVLMSVTASAAETVIMPAMHRAFKENSTGNLLTYLKRRVFFFVISITLLLLLISALISSHFSLDLMLILAPIPLFAAFSSIYMGVLNAEARHKEAVLGPLYGALTSIPLVFFFSTSAQSLACIFLFFEIGRFIGLWFHSRKCIVFFKNKHVSNADNIITWAIRGAKFQAAGSLLLSLNPFIDFLFAKKLGLGAVTNVEYANRLWNLVPVFFTGQLILAYAKMSRMASKNNINQKKIHFNAIKLGCSAIILSLAAILSTRPCINILYGFGKMNEINRIRLADLLACYLIGSGPFLGGLIYVKALSAEGKTDIIAYIAGVSVLINIMFNKVFINIYGLNGIGLATSFTYISSTILLGLGYYLGRK